MSASTYPDAKVIEASRNFVNVIAHRETEHGDHEVQVGKEKVKLCNEYLTIPCSVHVQGEGAVNKFFKGNLGTPTTVFCDPTGTELFRQAGSMGSGELVKKMNEALTKVTGDKVPLSVWQSGKQSVADGDAALEKKDYKKAIELYTKVAKLKGKFFKDMSGEAMAKVEEKGAALLEEALAIENIDEKKKALQKLVNDFKPLEISNKAKKELEGLK